MPLVHNERTKLTATWFNTLATALIAAGAFAPLAAVMYGLTPLPAGRTGVYATTFACFGIGCGLHLLGWLYLRRLRE